MDKGVLCIHSRTSSVRLEYLPSEMLKILSYTKIKAFTTIIEYVSTTSIACPWRTGTLLLIVRASYYPLFTSEHTEFREIEWKMIGKY